MRRIKQLKNQSTKCRLLMLNNCLFALLQTFSLVSYLSVFLSSYLSVCFRISKEVSLSAYLKKIPAVLKTQLITIEHIYSIHAHLLRWSHGIQQQQRNIIQPLYKVNVKLILVFYMFNNMLILGGN